MKSIEIKDLKIRYQTLVPTSIGKKLLRFNAVENKVFEAIKGITLSIESGDVIGLIGSNGSGKTTLLRCIAGIFTPDEGTVELFGNNVSLLSIGVGFDPQMTGYDNIFLSGLLMGFTKEQIRKRIDEIIEFAELSEFINMPVKTYSSGMHSRLAFSITAVMESDILLIDEVFSVGDARFKKKSAARMKEIIQEKSKTVVIVSHSMGTIQSLCNKVVWLEKGLIMKYGDSEEVIQAYEQYMDETKQSKPVAIDIK